MLHTTPHSRSRRLMDHSHRVAVVRETPRPAAPPLLPPPPRGPPPRDPPPPAPPSGAKKGWPAPPPPSLFPPPPPCPAPAPLCPRARRASEVKAPFPGVGLAAPEDTRHP